MKRNRRFKMIFALALAIILSLGTAVTVLANPTIPAEAQPDRTRAVSLTINHRILPDGTIVDGSPTGTPLPNPVGTPVQGAVWQMQRVEGAPAGFNPAATITDAILATLTLGPVVPLAATDANGQTVFNGTAADQGMWVISNVSTPAYYDPIPGNFLVNLPHWLPDTPGQTGEWLYDVHVFPKQRDQQPFEKEILNIIADDETVTLTWEFQVGLRDGLSLANLVPIPGSTDYIRIVDNLDPRQNFAGNAYVVVEFDNTAGTVTALTLGTHFTISYAPGVAGADSVLTMNINQAGRNFLAANAEQPGELRFRFDTYANLVDILNNDLGRLYNTGTLTLSNEPSVIKDMDTRPGDVPYTYLFGIIVNKVDLNNTALAGAVFHLFRAEQMDGLVPAAGETPVAIRTTPATGQVTFFGLPAGTYYIYEFAAPAGGFIRLETAIRVVIAEDLDSPYTVTLSVTNRRGFDLPLTGGAGTLLFTIIGLALIAGAVVLVSVNKKKKEI